MAGGDGSAVGTELVDMHAAGQLVAARTDGERRGTIQPNMLRTTGDGSLSTCRRCHAPLASRPKRYTAPLYNLAPRASGQNQRGTDGQRVALKGHRQAEQLAWTVTARPVGRSKQRQVVDSSSAGACERRRRHTEPVREDTSVRVLRRHASRQAGGGCRARARTERVHGRLLWVWPAACDVARRPRHEISAPAYLRRIG